jgi:hypothetical protein
MVSIKGIARQWYYARCMRLNRLNAGARVFREGSSAVSRARSPLALWLAALCVARAWVKVEAKRSVLVL